MFFSILKSIAFHFLVIALVSVAVVGFSSLLVGVINALSLHK